MERSSDMARSFIHSFFMGGVGTGLGLAEFDRRDELDKECSDYRRVGAAFLLG